MTVAMAVGVLLYAALEIYGEDWGFQEGLLRVLKAAVTTLLVVGCLVLVAAVGRELYDLIVQLGEDFSTALS